MHFLFQYAEIYSACKMVVFIFKLISYGSISIPKIDMLTIELYPHNQSGKG